MASPILVDSERKRIAIGLPDRGGRCAWCGLELSIPYLFFLGQAREDDWAIHPGCGPKLRKRGTK